MSTNQFKSMDIHHETSCIGKPNKNGRAERKHRHILNVTRVLHFQASLPIEFWDECILTACYLINRTPFSVLNGKTLYQLIHDIAPPYIHIRVFGSLWYAHDQHQHGDKFSSKSRRLHLCRLSSWSKRLQII